MKVDKVSNLEQNKMAFFNEHHQGKQGFGRWLTLELFTQIELSMTKSSFKTYKTSHDFNTQALKFSHEEKL
jgi:hypothetical protein